MSTFFCTRCGGSYDVDIDPAAMEGDDFQKFEDARLAHVDSHPESLKVGMQLRGNFAVDRAAARRQARRPRGAAS